MVLAALMLPVLQLVTLATLPLAAAYALLGLLLSPILVPWLVVKQIAAWLLSLPLLLATLPVAVPVGGVIAAGWTTWQVAKALWIALTPLLWPLYFLCHWWCATACVARAIVADTLLPFLVPLRYALLAALAPKALLS